MPSLFGVFCNSPIVYATTPSTSFPGVSTQAGYPGNSTPCFDSKPKSNPSSKHLGLPTIIGKLVGPGVGAGVGSGVRKFLVGSRVVGLEVGDGVLKFLLGPGVGTGVGAGVGPDEGLADGSGVGLGVGPGLGAGVGMTVLGQTLQQRPAMHFCEPTCSPQSTDLQHSKLGDATGDADGALPATNDPGPTTKLG